MIRNVGLILFLAAVLLGCAQYGGNLPPPESAYIYLSNDGQGERACWEKWPHAEEKGYTYRGEEVRPANRVDFCQ